MSDLEIRVVVSGAIANNTYIIRRPGNPSVAVIDPAGNGKKVIEALRDMGVGVDAYLLTHGHYDHIEGLGPVREAFRAPVMIHRDDADMLTNPSRNLSKYLGRGFSLSEADRILEDGDAIGAAGLLISVIATPGHTRGGVTFRVSDALFTGDTLFHLDAGRTDFPDSSTEDLYRSIEKLFALPGDFRVFPGHEESTTLGFERENNTFMKAYRRRRP